MGHIGSYSLIGPSTKNIEPLLATVEFTIDPVLPKGLSLAAIQVS